MCVCLRPRVLFLLGEGSCWFPVADAVLLTLQQCGTCLRSMYITAGPNARSARM